MDRLRPPTLVNTSVIAFSVGREGGGQHRNKTNFQSAVSGLPSIGEQEQWTLTWGEGGGRRLRGRTGDTGYQPPSPPGGRQKQGQGALYHWGAGKLGVQALPRISNNNNESNSMPHLPTTSSARGAGLSALRE